MPWQCNACAQTIEEDRLVCPGCEAPKTSWTLIPDATRTFVMTSRKFELLCAGKKTQQAPALTKVAAAAGKAIAPSQALTVRLHPKDHQDLTVTLGIGFATAPFAERSFEVERPADLTPEGTVDVEFLLVYGQGEPPPADAQPGHRIVDVSEASESGHAPLLEVKALGRRPKEVPVVGAAEPKQAEVLEFEDAQFHSGSAVLLPGHAEDYGTRVSGLGILAKALQHGAGRPELRLLVTGHTDSTGTMDANVELSTLRARSVYTALTGDREGWVEVANARDKPIDHQTIVAWADKELGWGCDPGPVDGQPGPKTRAGIEAFQRRYNQAFGQEIGVDGKVGPQTLGAFFDVYQRILAKELGTDAAGLAEKRAGLTFLEPGAVGCGEYHPISAARFDDYRSAENRRVELLFFPPEAVPELACHSGGACNPEACPIYDYEAYTTRHVDVEPAETTPAWWGGAVDPMRYHLRALLYEGDLKQPLANTSFVVRGPLETPAEAQEISGTTDDDGLASGAEPIPAGVYEVTVGEKTGRLAAVPYERSRYPVWLEHPHEPPLGIDEEAPEEDLHAPDERDEDPTEEAA